VKQKLAAATFAAGIAIATALVVRWEPAPGDRMLVAIRPIPTDPWTICYGHTGPDVYEGLRVTHEQCLKWRDQDVNEAAGHVLRCIQWPLTSNQFGALVDGAFNLGPQIVCGSTLQRKANAGDLEGACRELTHALNSDGGRRGWSFSAGTYFPGLRARRFDERAICWPDFANVVGGVA
jgi:lysozyme